MAVTEREDGGGGSTPRPQQPPPPKKPKKPPKPTPTPPPRRPSGATERDDPAPPPPPRPTTPARPTPPRPAPAPRPTPTPSEAARRERERAAADLRAARREAAEAAAWRAQLQALAQGRALEIKKAQQQRALELRAREFKLDALSAANRVKTVRDWTFARAQAVSRLTSFETLYRTTHNEDYRHQAAREREILAGLDARRKELEAESRFAWERFRAGEREDPDVAWRRNPIVAKTEIKDENDYMQSQLLVRRLLQDARNGKPLAPTWVMTRLMDQIRRYGESTSVEVARLGNQLEQIFEGPGTPEQKEKRIRAALEKNADLIHRHETLMGKPDGKSEGSLQDDFKSYSAWADVYNAELARRVGSALNGGTSLPILRKAQGTKQLAELKQKWAESGSKLSYEDWLEDEDQKLRTWQRVTTVAVDRILTQMNNTVGRATGTHYYMGADGQIKEEIDRTNPNNDVHVYAERAMGFLGKDRLVTEADAVQVHNRALNDWEAAVYDHVRSQHGDQAADNYIRSDEYLDARVKFDNRLRTKLNLSAPDFLRDSLGQSPVGLLWDLVQVPFSALSSAFRDFGWGDGIGWDLLDAVHPGASKTFRDSGLGGEFEAPYMVWGSHTSPFDDFGKWFGETGIKMRFGLNSSPENKRRAQERYDEYAQRSAEANERGDWREALRAYNDYGSQPFSADSDFGNALAQLAGDPLNWLPINPLTIGLRARRAISVTAGTSKWTRPGAVIWQVLRASPSDLRVSRFEKEIEQRLGENATVDDLNRFLERHITNASELAGETPLGVGIVNRFLRNYVDPVSKKIAPDALERASPQLRNLLEHELERRARDAGIEVVRRVRKEIEVADAADSAAKAAIDRRRSRAALAAERRALKGKEALAAVRKDVLDEGAPKPTPAAPGAPKPSATPQLSGGKPKTAAQRVTKKTAAARPKTAPKPKATATLGTPKPRAPEPVHRQANPVVYDYRQVDLPKLRRDSEHLSPERQRAVREMFGLDDDWNGVALPKTPEPRTIGDVVAEPVTIKSVVVREKKLRGQLPKPEAAPGRVPAPVEAVPAKTKQRGAEYTYLGTPRDPVVRSVSARLVAQTRKHFLRSRRMDEAIELPPVRSDDPLLNTPEYRAARVGAAKGEPSAILAEWELRQRAFRKRRAKDQDEGFGSVGIDDAKTRLSGARNKEEIGKFAASLDQARRDLSAALRGKGDPEHGLVKYVAKEAQERADFGDKGGAIIADTVTWITRNSDEARTLLKMVFRHFSADTPLTRGEKLLAQGVDFLVHGKEVTGKAFRDLLDLGEVYLTEIHPHVGFAVYGRYLFEAFHRLRLLPRGAGMRRLEALHTIALRRIVVDVLEKSGDLVLPAHLSGPALLKAIDLMDLDALKPGTLGVERLPDAMWLVMAERAGLDFALPVEVVDELFRQAAEAAGLNWHVALSMIPEGYRARRQVGRGRYSPVLNEVLDPSKVLGRSFLDGARNDVLGMLPERRFIGKDDKFVANEVSGLLVAKTSLSDMTKKALEILDWVVNDPKVGIWRYSRSVRNRLYDKQVHEGIRALSTDPIFDAVDRPAWAQVRNTDLGKAIQRAVERDAADLAATPKRRGPKSVATAEEQWEALWNFATHKYGVPVRRRYLTVNTFLREEINDLYWKVTSKDAPFVTHSSPGGHILAWLVKVNEGEVSEWATATRVFRKHMIRGAKVAPDNVDRLIRAFFGDRINQEVTRMWDEVEMTGAVRLNTALARLANDMGRVPTLAQARLRRKQMQESDAIVEQASNEHHDIIRNTEGETAPLDRGPGDPFPSNERLTSDIEDLADDLEAGPVGVIRVVSMIERMITQFDSVKLGGAGDVRVAWQRVSDAIRRFPEGKKWELWDALERGLDVELRPRLEEIGVKPPKAANSPNIRSRQVSIKQNFAAIKDILSKQTKSVWIGGEKISDLDPVASAIAKNADLPAVLTAASKHFEPGFEVAFRASGAFAAVLDIGNDLVLRVGLDAGEYPLSKHVIKPVEQGRAGSLSWAVVPHAQPRFKAKDFRGRDVVVEAGYSDRAELARLLDEEGFDLVDDSPENVAFVKGQGLVVIDPGAVVRKGERPHWADPAPALPPPPRAPVPSPAAAAADTLADALGAVVKPSDLTFLARRRRYLAAALKKLPKGTPDWAATRAKLSRAARAEAFVKETLIFAAARGPLAVKRRRFAKGVVSRVGDRVRDVVPEGRMAWYVQDPKMGQVEWVRDLQGRLSDAVLDPGPKLSKRITDELDRLTESGPDGVMAFVRIEQKVADAIAAKFGRRTTFLDAPHEAIDDGVLRLRPPANTAAQDAVRREVLKAEGFSLEAYDEARAVLRPGVVKWRETTRLAEEAKAASAVPGGGTYRENFLEARALRAADEGPRLLERMAYENYGLSDVELVDMLQRRFSRDGELHKLEFHISAAQKYVYERAIKTLSGGIDNADDVLMRQFLKQNRPASLGINKRALSRYMQENGFWNARDRRAFSEGARHWDIEEQAAFHWRQYREIPDYLDFDKMKERGYFTDYTAHERESRIAGERDDDAWVRSQMEKLSEEEQVKLWMEGDEARGIAPRRTAQEQREFMIGLWGDRILDSDGNLKYFHWLMTPEEIGRTNYLPRWLTGREMRATKAIESVDEVDAFMRAAKEVLDDLDAQGKSPFRSGGTVEARELSLYADRVAAKMARDPVWIEASIRKGKARRLADWVGPLLRALTVAHPAFVAINLPDMLSRIAVGRVDNMRLGLRGNWKLADERIRSYQTDIDFMSETSFDRASRRLGPTTRERLRHPRRARLPQRRGFKEDVTATGTWVTEMFPGFLSKTEGLGRDGLARQIYAQRVDYFTNRARILMRKELNRDLRPADLAKADGLGDAMTRLFVRQEIERFFPSLRHASHAEKLVNQFIPFASYRVRNKLFWLNEIMDHPVWLNRLRLAGDALREYNEGEWERNHPGVPYKDDGTIEVFGVKFDPTMLSDATRGLSLLDEKKTLRLGNLLYEWFAPMSPATIAGVHMITDALGWTGHLVWVYDPETGTWSRERRGDGEPWSGEPATFASFLWPLEWLNLLGKLAKDGWSATDLTRIVHKTLFYGDPRVIDPMRLTNDAYWSLREQGKDAEAKAFLAANPGLKAWWAANKMFPRDWISPEGLDPDAPFEPPERLYGSEWLREQDPSYRYKIGKLFGERADLFNSFQTRLDAAILANDLKLASAIRRERQAAILEFYALHPELTWYESVSQSPERWAQRLENWATDDLVDRYFSLLGTRPERRDGETAAAYQQRRMEWEDKVRLFEGTYPQVKEKLRGSVESIAHAREHQDLVWGDALRRFGELGVAIEAAKRRDDYATLDLIYGIRDFDAHALESEAYAIVRPGDLGRTSRIFAGVSLPDFSNVRLSRMTDDQRKQEEKNRWYAKGMKDLIAEVKANPKEDGEFNGALFVDLLKKNPDLLREYFDRHPGKEAEWARNEDYIRQIGRFGRLLEKDKLDEAFEYFDSLPDWVKARYFENNPDSKMKDGVGGNPRYREWWGRFHKLMESGRKEAAFTMYNNMPAWVRKLYFDKHPEKKREWEQNKAYGDWWDRFHRLMDSGRRQEAFAMYNDMPDWVRSIYRKNNPDWKAKGHKNGEYGAYMQRWVKFFERDDVAGGMAYFKTLPQWVQDRYFKTHPGKRQKWARAEEYVGYMGEWVSLLEKDRFDEASRYFDNLPQWVKERYYQNHPDRRGGSQNNARFRQYGKAMGNWVALLEAKQWDDAERYFKSLPEWIRAQYYKNNPNGAYRGGNNRPHGGSGMSDARFRAYTAAMGEWVAHFERGDYEGASQYFANLPTWMKEQYWKNHPESRREQAENREYIDAMAKWVALYREGNEADAEAFFRSLPQWIQKRYLAKHPDKALLGESLEMVALITEYFQGDEAHKAAFAAQHPEVLAWVNSHSGESQRLSILLTVYKQLPEDEWIRRSFREMYPEVFSAEARGERRAISKWETAAKWGMTEEMAKWMEALSLSAQEAMKYSIKPPKPMQMVRPKRRRKHTNTYSARDLAYL
jgi:hypothetical protein